MNGRTDRSAPKLIIKQILQVRDKSIFGINPFIHQACLELEPSNVLGGTGDPKGHKTILYYASSCMTTPIGVSREHCGSVAAGSCNPS